MRGSPRDEALLPYLYSIREDEFGKFVVEGAPNHTLKGMFAFKYDRKNKAIVTAMMLNDLIGELYDQGVLAGYDIGYEAGGHSK